MKLTLTWNGQKVKAETIKVSKKAVKLTADQTAKAIKFEYPGANVLTGATGGTKASIKVSEWEKDNAVGAYVNVGEKGREHIPMFKELGTVNQPADPILRKNLRKSHRKFTKSMTNKI